LSRIDILNMGVGSAGDAPQSYDKTFSVRALYEGDELHLEMLNEPVR